MYSWPMIKRLNFYCHIIYLLMDRNLLGSDVTSLGKLFPDISKHCCAFLFRNK
jgi:hypothetical protein